MNIYIPRYHIASHLAPEEASARRSNTKRLQRGPPAGLEQIGAYIIPETEFFAVTAYRNNRISGAKISRNHYANEIRSRQRLLK